MELTLLQENSNNLGLAYDPNKLVTEMTAERALNDEELSLSDELEPDLDGKAYVEKLLAVRNNPPPMIALAQTHLIPLPRSPRPARRSSPTSACASAST